MEDKNWKLDKLTLKFNDYGKNKGKYTGRIEFSNSEFESFSFKIQPDMADKYIEIISEDIVLCADNLASRLVHSLGLKK